MFDKPREKRFKHTRAAPGTWSSHFRQTTQDQIDMVARARLKSSLSQNQFAAILGVSRRTLEQWEQGRRQPSDAAKTLIKIADSRPDVLKEINASR